MARYTYDGYLTPQVAHEVKRRLDLWTFPYVLELHRLPDNWEEWTKKHFKPQIHGEGDFQFEHVPFWVTKKDDSGGVFLFLGVWEYYQAVMDSKESLFMVKNKNPFKTILD